MSSSTLQRLMMSAKQEPESMLDRLHGGTLPAHKANELVSNVTSNNENINFIYKF